MTTKAARAIVCEGKDDLAALRAMLAVEGATQKRMGLPPGQVRFESDRVTLTLESVDGKSDLAERTLLAAEGGAIGRPDMVLVSFDPDLDPQKREFEFFEKAFETGRKRRAGAITRISAGRLQFRIQNRDVTVLPAPWRCPEGATFAGLPADHCIERVLIEGILKCRPHQDPLTSWAEDATTRLHTIVATHGHKRAFRIWSAALFPDSESFVARLLEAHETKNACLQALRSTPTGAALRTLLGLDE